MCKLSRILSIVIMIVLPSAGCGTIGSWRIGAQHFSVDTLEKPEPGKSYAEAAFDRIAEGDYSRRVVGWTDVKT